MTTVARLAAELHARGLLPSRQTYVECQREIDARGELLIEQFSRAISPRIWNRGIAAIGDSSLVSDCRRVSGFGESLTRFLIAPIPITEGQREAVAILGALANLIVALFDLIVDAGVDRRSVLSPAMLSLLASRRLGRLGMLLTIGAAPRAALIARLVRLYFVMLRRISGDRSDPVLRAVLRGIARMYELEGRGSTEIHVRASTVVRKSAFPLVVMALPGWLYVPRDRRDAMRAHQRWLYKTARFIRWVDDAADEVLDAREQHPNLFLACRHDAVAAVADRASSLITAWRKDAHGSSEDGFTSCVLSWFGGPSVLDDVNASTL